MSKQTGIQKTDDVVIQNVDWLLSLVDPEDKDVVKALTAIKKHYLKSVALAIASADEYRKQRDSALDELEVAGVGMTNLERMVDDLIVSIEDLRARALHPERQVAERIKYQMDLTSEQAETLINILTGSLDVYLSHYTEGDLREYIEIALGEVDEARYELEEDGGMAE